MNEYKCTTTEGEDILKSLSNDDGQLKIDFDNVQTSNQLIWDQPKVLDTTPQSEYHLEWIPKEDITTFELAKCIPLIIQINKISLISSCFIDIDQPYMRHFKITKV